MTCNFDSNIFVDDNTEGLVSFWEKAEADYIRKIEVSWYNVMVYTTDYEWKHYLNEVNDLIRDAEDELARFGIVPNLQKIHDCLHA